MKIVAIIPARGQSKSLPSKNIKKLAGKPLIGWTIEGALKSKKLSRVIVSTDNFKIAKVARKFGAEVPFLRPAELATDTIGIELTLRHAYEWLKQNEAYGADALVLLMPTSPLRQTYHIDEAVRIFEKTGADSVVAVNKTPANHTPYWTLTRSKTGKVSLWGGIDLKKILTRRQDFPQECYARNDLVYVLKPKNLYDKKPNLYGNKVELYVINDSAYYEADINTPDEWEDAGRKLIKLIKKQKK